MVVVVWGCNVTASGPYFHHNYIDVSELYFNKSDSVKYMNIITTPIITIAVVLLNTSFYTAVGSLGMPGFMNSRDTDLH
jgi:hypothetical protein